MSSYLLRNTRHKGTFLLNCTKKTTVYCKCVLTLTLVLVMLPPNWLLSNTFTIEYTIYQLQCTRSESLIPRYPNTTPKPMENSNITLLQYYQNQLLLLLPTPTSVSLSIQSTTKHAGLRLLF